MSKTELVSEIQKILHSYRISRVYKGKHVNLSPVFSTVFKEVLDYLTSDQTIRLPNDAGGFKEPKPDLFGQINSDEEWSDWSEDEESANQSEVIHPFPEFGQRIQKIIMGMKKRVVPKLNWSCPSDAKWQMPDNTVRIGLIPKCIFIIYV